MVARIEALTVEDVRRAGAAHAARRRRRSPSIGPVGKVLTPDRVAARLQGV